MYFPIFLVLSRIPCNWQVFPFETRIYQTFRGKHKNVGLKKETKWELIGFCALFLNSIIYRTNIFYSHSLKCFISNVLCTVFIPLRFQTLENDHSPFEKKFQSLNRTCHELTTSLLLDRATNWPSRSGWITPRLKSLCSEWNALQPYHSVRS